MSRTLLLTPEERQLLHEALGYMGRRFRDPQDSELILEIEARLDQSRREADPHGQHRVPLEAAHRQVLKRVIASYTSEIDVPSSDRSNRLLANKLRVIAQRLDRRRPLLDRIRHWIQGR